MDRQPSVKGNELEIRADGTLFFPADFVRNHDLGCKKWVVLTGRESSTSTRVEIRFLEEFEPKESFIYPIVHNVDGSVEAQVD